ncbi:hypothetical protein FJT64_023483 [Amphibalanus amphitrite]|uniref:Uncharacterized protein n=1 Tax=Amphibalanus amphitrite TaxID=1232801 RepID=A0A6A4WFK5_AMPAM|nr:hypothetical protein FJT64_023483 [Amphibalanus amphitrite]
MGVRFHLMYPCDGPDQTMESLLLATPVKIPRPKFHSSRRFYPKEPPKDYMDEPADSKDAPERKTTPESYTTAQLSKDLQDKL